MRRLRKLPLSLSSAVLFYADISKTASSIPELFLDFATTERTIYRPTDIKVFRYLPCFWDRLVGQTDP